MVDGYGGAALAASANEEVWRRGFASAAALVLTLLFGVLVYLVIQSNDERDEAARSERQSFETIMAVRNIEESMARAEVALGRFVINGDSTPATIYRNERRAAARQIESLQRIVRGYPAQAERAERLETLYDAYGSELAAITRLTSAGQNFDALARYNSVANSQNGVAVIATLDEIAAYERTLLSGRSAARIETNERARILANLLTVAGIILAIVALILAYATIRAFRQRFDADQRAEELEDAVAERTAELEALNAQLRAEVAERTAAEQKLNQAQKLEAVGQLTGGIAHDFNNMLAVVIGGLDLAKRKMAEQPERANEHIENALEGANRAAALTRRLLTFARAEPFLPEGTDAAARIDTMADLLRRSIGEQITVAIEADSDIWPLWVDPHQLENAVLNLAVNARDAMDGKGELTIAIRNRTLADDEVGDIAAGDYVQIAVTDTGSGMDDGVIEHVFEPFFTTKPVGKGTGLGLSQIFGFVRQSGGDVRIDSTVNEGTTVSLFLPRFDGDVVAPEAPAAAASGGNGARDGLTILLVEDDQRVRRSTTAGLEELGHVVLACANGPTAIDVLAERPDIDLLLTDVVMPDMTGPELADRVAASHPDLPVIFVTGYAREAIDGEQFSGHAILRKPFTIAALADAVANAAPGNRRAG
ncbi:response regulator [Parasphingopyxis algicola]|uniref:ATP-binding protein n=1 Tax=Parasphingopyxis algicola TaxID=2026624 RepID=UPI0015A3A404|nr:ATP-binding protein [Parasphingopyxis algicola]QLC26330.1 response regulator [Parasphingopyxis algicola]